MVMHRNDILSELLSQAGHFCKLSEYSDIQEEALPYDSAVIQWITPCHK